MRTRSENEIALRDQDAMDYDDWYLERGINAVWAEDETIIRSLSFSSTEKQSFLDFGSGTGRLTARIQRQFPSLDVHALDISPKSLDALNNKGLSITTNVLDASKDSISYLNLPKFDRILSMQMIQHLEKDGAVHAIKEIYDSLKEDGIAVIELYNFGGLNRVIERIRARGGIKKVQQQGLFFEYRFSADEFKKFVTNHSRFKDVSIYGCQNINRRLINRFGSLLSLDLKLSTIGCSKYLGYYFIAVLKKS